MKKKSLQNLIITFFLSNKRAIVILLNFEITGEMEINPEGGAEATGSNETEPTKSVRDTRNSSNIVSMVAAAAATSQSGMFKGLKIFGIIDLNPYQNK